MGVVILGGLFALIVFWLYMGWRNNVVYRTRMRALDMSHEEWRRLFAMVNPGADDFSLRLEAASTFSDASMAEVERVSYARMLWTFWRKPSSFYDWSKFRAEG